MMMSARTTVAAATLGVALALAGCSSAADDDASGAATTQAAAPTVDTGSDDSDAADASDGADATEGADAAEGSDDSTAEASEQVSREFLAVETLDGAQFDPAVTQDKGVILWFWAPWCTICRGEAPEVAEVAAELEASGSPVVLLGVPGRGQVPEMEDFVADTGTGEMTHLVDVEGVLWRDFGVVYQPAFALLGTDGEVEVVNGALGGDGLRDAVAQLADG
ncbi:redoxin domain-containing protein [Nostocoides sp. F2B08]|uniref:thioredoxin domain-containing protein n=1 Tax=Nostocoides sp. F2B08 TaxID=2653936 RepID=UPI00126381C6|nr:thioredoxin domain-containing protein [Tetrasphaera sp. F2B08]KAB7745599.1 redoxin domain-containing protein [Tetrasphaera sp. F2B08]